VIQQLKHTLLLLILVGLQGSLGAQEETDAFMLQRIHRTALTDGKAYTWLTHLSEEIGGRLAGSDQSMQAIEYTRRELEALQLDRVWLQPCTVPHWERGAPEKAMVTQIGRRPARELKALALGNSPASPPEGVQGPVVEVRSLDEVDYLADALLGSIVFFNRPMDPGELHTFHAYGKAVDQRVYGPAKAAQYGALGAIVRSMTTRLDDIPHTGVTLFPPNVTPIPALAISTLDAEWLSEELAKGFEREVYLYTDCKDLGTSLSYNVIGEIRGREFPDEIILVGGHLDSWDVGGGAHDDGAGCVQSMEVLRLLQRVGYEPRRTIRCVLFMNEENGLGGGRAYADSARLSNEWHLAAIESDAGGFSPRGFSFEADPEVFVDFYSKVNTWLPLFEPYGIQFSHGGSGADISPLKFQKGLLAGLRPDSQRYFDYHHTATDRIDAVHPRELALGAAAMASLVYLLDKYGL
jgi:carboxypeptidase Q